MRYPLRDYKSCSFCADIAGTRACAFVCRTETAAVLIDERQYERGAMLVVPRQHRESVIDITPDEIASVYQLAQRVAKAATHAFHAVGVNVFQNNGSKAGQREPHFHVHVVPRYEESDPDRLFSERDHSPASIAEQLEVAAMIRSALS